MTVDRNSGALAQSLRAPCPIHFPAAADVLAVAFRVPATRFHIVAAGDESRQEQ